MTASDATGPATVPDGATARFVRRPAITSSVVALAAGGVAVALVADTALQREILRLAVGGALAFRIGARLVRHGGTALRALGALIALGGGLVVLVAVGQAATQSPQVTHRVELLPGLWVCGRSPRRLRRSGSGGVGP